MSSDPTALIVDDERRAVTLLKKLLEETGEFSALWSTTSTTTALELVKKNKPDIIFLDIRMPNQDGFEFLSSLRKTENNVEIVFVTAYDQFTMKALKNHAFGYLLKPVVREELKDCIREFKLRKGPPNVNNRLTRFLADYEANRKIRFNTRSGFFQIDPSGIVYCSADGNYTNINTGESNQVCALNLGAVMETLPHNGFIRIGRSLIVNRNYIYKVDRKSGVVTFDKGGRFITVSLSRSQVKELDKLI
jgi:two-component system, LytTR family, response regulator